MLGFFLLCAAAATPAAIPFSTAAITVQAPADCQAQIGSLKGQVASATFIGKQAEKERAGLTGKLDSAAAELAAGKNADAAKKIEDFRLKVENLKATGKIDPANADALLAGAAAASACIASLPAS